MILTFRHVFWYTHSVLIIFQMLFIIHMLVKLNSLSGFISYKYRIIILNICTTSYLAYTHTLPNPWIKSEEEAFQKECQIIQNKLVQVCINVIHNAILRVVTLMIKFMII